MLKIKNLLIILIIAAGVSYSQVKINFVEYDLPNGLHVILHQDNSVPVVSQVLAYHVGSKNENPDRTGFAHFFEHLMFEGSPNIPRGEFFKMVQNAGGQLNAFTSFDKTVYFITLPSNQLELAMWMESERMLQLKIDSIGVETQRGVVKEERKQSLENRPYGTAQLKIFEKSYTVHPYRWTPIGEAQYIDKAGYDEFREFYKTFYVPNNACLVIAGDIDIEKTKKLVAKYYGEIPKGTKAIFRPNIKEPKKTAEVVDTTYDKVQLPAVIFAYHVPEQGSPDYYAYTMLNKLFTQGESSRLNKRLVDNDKIALGVYSFPMDLEDPSLLVCFALTNFGKSPADLEKAMTEEIEKVKTEYVSDEEITKMKNQIENDYLEKFSTNQGKAMELANYHLFFGSADLLNSEINKFLAVTKDDLKRVANQYLNKENRLLLYILPKQN